MIKIEYPKDLVYNAGVVGLLRVLDIHSKEDLEFSGLFNDEDDSISIDENLLGNFTDKYFDCLAEQLRTLSTFSRIKKSYCWLADNRVGNEHEEDFLSTYNDRLDKFVKQVKAYYERRGVSSILFRFD
ncbi:MAG TPA: hypothetical protein DCS83_07775, partial [Prevotella sp.]|nr:hypothetical protein [Prevotella sp.]